jgi:hypothetical protein
LAQYHTLTKLISIFLLSALILQTGFKVFLYLNYEVNKEAITLKYCENKSKPKMKCHGKCHLTKQLKEQGKREVPGNNLKELTETHLYSQPLQQILQEKTLEKCPVNFGYILRIPEKNHRTLFHPPTS